MLRSPMLTVARRPALVTNTRLRSSLEIKSQCGRFDGLSKNVFHLLMAGGRPDGATRVPTVMKNTGCRLVSTGLGGADIDVAQPSIWISGSPGRKLNCSRPDSPRSIGQATS